MHPYTGLGEAQGAGDGDKSTQLLDSHDFSIIGTGILFYKAN
jgi:hypothetical protein